MIHSRAPVPALRFALLLSVVSALIPVAGPALAGPNAGGTLVVHDCGFEYCNDSASFPSPAPACSAIDNEIDLDVPRVWKVYAAFADSSSPRLRALSWGISLTPGVVVQGAGLPDPVADFEITQGGWPGTSGAGIGMSFGTTKTETVTECYWFGGYAYGAPGVFATAVHPVQASVFVDDSTPPLEDPVAAFSAVGFGQPGLTICPGPLPVGACCSADGSCAIAIEATCIFSGGAWQGPGTSCAPYPCPHPTVPGDLIESALVIPSLPFSDSGNTTPFFNDYDEACPYGGSTAPDVVYRYTPDQDRIVRVNLCDSAYDTKVYIYRDSAGDLIACNDDGGCNYGSYASVIHWCLLEAGHTYYIVVDGYGTTHGPYELAVTLATEPGACCYPDGGCLVQPPTDCLAAGGTYHGDDCNPNPCVQPDSGACCFPDGTCTPMLEPACVAAGGVFHATTCSPNPCPQPGTGACCHGSACTMEQPAECAASGGLYLGGPCSPSRCTGTPPPPPPCDCPPGALQEGEPPCVDNYEDSWNGGCNSSGWTWLIADGSGCATICGRSCTYLYQGLSYRDTDWYWARSATGPIHAAVTAQFPLQLILVWGPDCDNLGYEYIQTATCEPASLSGYLAPGSEFWVWVGPSVFSGVPESGYVLQVCNIVGGPTPTRVASWGAVKAWYFAPAARKEGPGRLLGDPGTAPEGPRSGGRTGRGNHHGPWSSTPARR